MFLFFCLMNCFTDGQTGMSQLYIEIRGHNSKAGILQDRANRTGS